MGQEWYYSRNGQKHGPISGAELKQLAAAGKLLPTDHVWKEGMEKWVPVRSVKGLIPAAQAPVATVAPPPPVKVDALIPVEAIKPAEVVEAVPIQAKAPLRERVGELLSRAKKHWPKLSTPAKVGIVGGAAGGGLLLLLLLCILPLTWFFGGSSGSSSLSVRQIVQAYVNDPVAADKKYKDKTLTVEGMVWIEATPGGFNSVHLEVDRDLEEKSHMTAMADFGEKDRSRVQKIKRGTAIRFRGLCRGVKDKHLEFINCEFISPSEAGDSRSPADGTTTGGSDKTTDTKTPPKGQQDGSLGYTAKAQKTTEGKRLKKTVKDVRPGSRADLLQALAVIGGQKTAEIKTQQGQTQVLFGYQSCAMIVATWETMFGDAERLPNGIEFVGTSSMEYKRWRVRCVDGSVILTGGIYEPERTTDHVRRYNVATVIFE